MFFPSIIFLSLPIKSLHVFYKIKPIRSFILWLGTYNYINKKGNVAHVLIVTKYVLDKNFVICYQLLYNIHSIPNYRPHRESANAHIIWCGSKGMYHNKIIFVIWRKKKLQC